MTDEQISNVWRQYVAARLPCGGAFTFRRIKGSILGDPFAVEQ